MKEVWKYIVGTNRKYKVSTLGRVKSLQGKNEKLMLPYTSKGYVRIKLVVNGRRRAFQMHQLVATAFIPNPQNKPEVNHIDGDKNNNTKKNLEWNTRSENMLHVYKTGLNSSVGENHHNSKLTQKNVDEIRTKYVPRKCTMKELGEMYGVRYGTISSIINNRTWAK